MIKPITVNVVKESLNSSCKLFVDVFYYANKVETNLHFSHLELLSNKLSEQ
jgi:hypothetical protein